MRTILLGLLLVAMPTDPQDASVHVSGHAVHLDVVTPAHLSRARPTIVFESGLGEIGTKTWDRVLPLLPRDLRLVRYDRPGLGASDDDGASPTPRHIAELLHEALAVAHVPPPYVLVGHSLAGTRIRMFAGLYPTEVAALVFVEPTPDFTHDPDDDLRDIFEPLGLGRKEQQEMRARDQQPAGLSPVLQRELEMAKALQAGNFAELRSLPPIPEVPVIVLVGDSLAEWPTSAPGLSFDMRRWAKQWLKVRNESMRRFATSLPQGTFVETAKSSHQLQNSEPELVAWAIQRAMRH